MAENTKDDRRFLALVRFLNQAHGSETVGANLFTFTQRHHPELMPLLGGQPCDRFDEVTEQVVDAPKKTPTKKQAETPLPPMDWFGLLSELNKIALERSSK